MSDKDIRYIRSGVCAIGYLKGEVKDFINNINDFVIIGTGFLVRPTTVITNRHVIEALQQKQKELGFLNEQRFLEFVYPIGKSKWQTVFCRFNYITVLVNQDLDVGFIEFNRRPDSEFNQVSPLNLGDPLLVATGQPIGVIGYAYGTDLLSSEGDIVFDRFGPIFQQGYISAVAPIDDISDPDKFLLDINCAGGMSGSPVFRKDDGAVIGLFHGGMGGMVGFAIPIDMKRVNSWLKAHDENPYKQKLDLSNTNK